jgi:hypothetical protein
MLHTFDPSGNYLEFLYLSRKRNIIIVKIIKLLLCTSFEPITAVVIQMYPMPYASWVVVSFVFVNCKYNVVMEGFNEFQMDVYE